MYPSFQVQVQRDSPHETGCCRGGASRTGSRAIEAARCARARLFSVPKIQDSDPPQSRPDTRRIHTRYRAICGWISGQDLQVSADLVLVKVFLYFPLSTYLREMRYVEVKFANCQYCWQQHFKKHPIFELRSPSYLSKIGEGYYYSQPELIWTELTLRSTYILPSSTEDV